MKRIISLLLALVIAISAAIPAYATGDGNMDSGGSGMGDGTKTNYWNPGMDGVRLSVVHADNRAVIGSVVDWSNQKPNANIAHFGKVSKLSYNVGRTLSPAVGGYVCVQPTQKLPKIISTGSSKASIAAIRSYFTDEQVIRAIAGYVGIDFDLLISGDYRIVVEPLAYLCYNGQQFAMTATEAALYDQVVDGDLRKKLGTLTHKNLPLAIFLEEADLGYAAWPGSRTEKASNGDIISSLGIGIVRFNEVTTPPEPGEYDYEYRVNTEVITSVEVRGGQSDPDNPVSVRFNIQGRTYTVSNVYYPDGDSQLAWVRWRTPAEPCVITISVSVYGGGSAQGTIICNIVDLDGNDPPNPLADDRNNGFRLASVPQKEQVTSTSWGIWSPWWQENWEWVENWQKCWHTDRWTDADGKTHRDRWYHWVDNGWWEDHGWWEFDYNGYSASLVGSMKITPDEKSPTATASTLKSGYGVQEKVTAKVTTNQSAAVTAAQNAVTYFPEFGYENYWRLLEAEISGRSTTFQFKANPYSTYNRRTHFTPIWYPDGSYTPKMKCSDSASKAIIPGKKMPWRLYDENGQAQCDLIAMDGEVIEAGKPVTMVNLDSDAIERTVTFTPTAVKPLLVPHILGGQLAMELPSIAEKKAYIAKQLTEETWESELRLECPHKHYVNMTPAVAECRARMYAELHGGKV